MQNVLSDFYTMSEGIKIDNSSINTANVSYLRLQINLIEVRTWRLISVDEIIPDQNCVELIKIANNLKNQPIFVDSSYLVFEKS